MTSSKTANIIKLFPNIFILQYNILQKKVD